MASTSSGSLARVGRSLVLFNRLTPVRYYAVDLAIVCFPLVLAAPGRLLTVQSALAVVSIHLARLGGLILDDYADREADAIAAPDRPIPRGLVSPGEALVLGIGAVVAGAATAALVGPTFLAVLVVAYAMLFSSFGLLNDVDVPVVATAATVTSVSMLSLLGWVVHGDLSVAAGMVFMATWCWDWAHDALGAARDRAGDEAAGIATVGDVLTRPGVGAVAGLGILASTGLLAWVLGRTLATATVASYALFVAVPLAIALQSILGFVRESVSAGRARRAVEWYLVVAYGLATGLVLLVALA